MLDFVFYLGGTDSLKVGDVSGMDHFLIRFRLNDWYKSLQRWRSKPVKMIPVHWESRLP